MDRNRSGRQSLSHRCFAIWGARQSIQCCMDVVSTADVHPCSKSRRRAYRLQRRKRTGTLYIGRACSRLVERQHLRPNGSGEHATGEPEQHRARHLNVSDGLARSPARREQHGIWKHRGGEGGIRTHGTRKGTTVFETVPIDHSGTSPRGNRACQMAGPVDRGRASNVVVVAAQAAACAARKSN